MKFYLPAGAEKKKCLVSKEIISWSFAVAVFGLRASLAPSDGLQGLRVRLLDPSSFLG